MNMKNGDMAISYTLRKLAFDKTIQGMVKGLYEEKDTVGPISLYLPYANDRMNKVNENMYLNGEEVEYDSCFKLEDSQLINELTRLGVLSHKSDVKFYEWDDENGSACGLIIKNPAFIEHYHKWIRDLEHILNYGVFSLHTFTGEAYCLDNRGDFKTSSGIFRVFQELMRDPSHVLTYNQVADLCFEEHVQDFEVQVVHQAIYDIREKLKIKGDMSELIVSADKKYLLRTM